MSNDLKEKIARLPDFIEIPPAPAIDSIRRQGTSRRHRKLIGLALFSLLLLLGSGALIDQVIEGIRATERSTGAASIDRSTESGPSARPPSIPNVDPYVFTNVRIVNQSPTTSGDDKRYDVTIEYDVAWSTTFWPGIYECLWTAHGADGSVVGQLNDAIPFLKGEPEAKNLRKVISVSAPSERATIVCTGERLDGPGSTYEEAEPDRR